jgi:uncharacterized protein (DUF1810 family)
VTPFNQFFGSYLTVEDLAGQDLQAVVDRYEVKSIDEKERLLLHLRDQRKPLVLNRTNARSISELHGPDVDLWVGKSITLFATETDFGGKTVPCIRVRTAS